MTDVSTREGRLAALIEDLQQMRDEWDALGRPTMTEGARGNLKTHPLVTMLRETEEMAERMSRPLTFGAGRPAGAQSAPDRVSDRAPGKRAALKSVPISGAAAH